MPSAPESASAITRLLLDARQGDDAALHRLYPLVYEELRRLASIQLRGRAGTLHTTALVHEAYLKLFDGAHVDVHDRAHFFALSARAMRQVLIDHFRRRVADKRGGAQQPATLLDGQIPTDARGAVLLDLDEALDRLAQFNARLAQVVEYKFYGGMTQEEIAQVLGVTDRTVRSDWRKAKAWLAHALAEAA